MIGPETRRSGTGICKPICKPDTAGGAETGETRKGRRHHVPPVRRGQRGERRRAETAETYVLWLMTQSS